LKCRALEANAANVSFSLAEALSIASFVELDFGHGNLFYGVTLRLRFTCASLQEESDGK
jgi:hypothetical protein